MTATCRLIVNKKFSHFPEIPPRTKIKTHFDEFKKLEYPTVHQWHRVALGLTESL